MYLKTESTDSIWQHGKEEKSEALEYFLSVFETIKLEKFVMSQH